MDERQGSSRQASAASQMTAGPQRGARCWSGGCGFAQSRRVAGQVGAVLSQIKGSLQREAKTASADPGPSHPPPTCHLDQAPSTRFSSLASGRVCVVAMRRSAHVEEAQLPIGPRAPLEDRPHVPLTQALPATAHSQVSPSRQAGDQGLVARPAACCRHLHQPPASQTPKRPTLAACDTRWDEAPRSATAAVQGYTWRQCHPAAPWPWTRHVQSSWFSASPRLALSP